MEKIKQLLNFPQPLLQTFPVWWVIPVVLLVGADLFSKKLVTDNLRFWLSAAQGAQHQPLQMEEITRHRESRSHIDVLGPDGRYIKLRLVFNDRFAFSLGPSNRAVGLLVNLFAIVFLFFYRAHSPGLGSSVAWLAIFAGAIGNYIDKLFLKSLATGSWTFSLTPQRGGVIGVVDFIECIWFDWSWAQQACLNLPVLGRTCPIGFLGWPAWPTFNLADSLISCGIAALLVSMFLVKSPEAE